MKSLRDKWMHDWLAGRQTGNGDPTGVNVCHHYLWLASTHTSRPRVINKWSYHMFCSVLYHPSAQPVRDVANKRTLHRRSMMTMMVVMSEVYLMWSCAMSYLAPIVASRDSWPTSQNHLPDDYYYCDTEHPCPFRHHLSELILTQHGIVDYITSKKYLCGRTSFTWAVKRSFHLSVVSSFIIICIKTEILKRRHTETVWRNPITKTTVPNSTSGSSTTDTHHGLCHGSWATPFLPHLTSHKFSKTCAILFRALTYSKQCVPPPSTRTAE